MARRKKALSAHLEVEPALLTTEEAALYLRIEETFLTRDRREQAQIPFVRLGTRTVRYRRKDLDAYTESRLCSSTASEAAQRQIAGA